MDKRFAAKMSAERTGRPQLKNLGRTGPGRIKQGPIVLDWQIVRALTSGLSATEAGILFGMQTRTVAARAESLHLAFGSVFLTDQGKVFRDATLRDICDRCGFLTEGDFEKAVGLKRRGAGIRKGGPQAIRVPATARTVREWRDGVIIALTGQKRDKNRPYRNHEVIHTLLPDLGNLRYALAEVFAEIRTELKHHSEWTIENVWNFTAEQGRREGEGSTWHRTMRYLWEIERILGEKLDRLRRTESIAGFVREILGDRYRVHPQQIKLAMQRGIRTIRPERMLGLILSMAAAAPASTTIPPSKPATKPRGHKRGYRTPETNRRIELAAALRFLGQSPYKMAPRIYPDQHKRANAETATYKLFQRYGEEIKERSKSFDREEAARISLDK
jgi:hypothetical protein